MAKINQSPFNPSGGYVARKSFRFQGKDYVLDQTFPWRRLSCSARKLRQLYEGRFITLASGKRSKEVEPNVKVPLKEDTPKTTDESENEVLKVIFDPEVHLIENPEHGQWFITRGGQKVIQITRKEAHRLRKRTKAGKVNSRGIVDNESS